MKPLCRRDILILGLCAAGCVGPREIIPPPVPEGFYHLESKAFYEGGLVKVTGDGRGGLDVLLLDQFGGRFRLAKAGDGQFSIRDAQIDIHDVDRSLRGEGQLHGQGGMEGNCVVWVGSVLGLSRNHRSQPWTLRPVSADDAQRGLAKLRKRYPGRLESLGL
jgi:hypothetical protein